MVAMWRKPMVGGKAILPYSPPLHPEPQSGGSSRYGGNRVLRQNHHPVRTASFTCKTWVLCHLMALEKIQVFFPKRALPGLAMCVSLPRGLQPRLPNVVALRARDFSPPKPSQGKRVCL